MQKGNDTMRKEPMDVFNTFPVRKSRKQKAAFREEAGALARSWGYQVREETGRWDAAIWCWGTRRRRNIW